MGAKETRLKPENYVQWIAIIMSQMYQLVTLTVKLCCFTTAGERVVK